MEGLEGIVRARGGYETLQDDMMLNCLVFWYENPHLPLFTAFF